jgi:hypothetical protein
VVVHAIPCCGSGGRLQPLADGIIADAIVLERPPLTPCSQEPPWPPMPPLARPDYALSDSLWAAQGKVYLTGTQALLRVMLMQARRDRAAGMSTQGFLSGYRGSPLGAVDLAVWKAGERFTQAGLRFLPAVNEELAATAVLGTQRVESDPAPLRRRVRDLVRQGARRGSGRRCAASRQCLWLLAHRRRAGGGRRRSWLRVELDAAPE